MRFRTHHVAISCAIVATALVAMACGPADKQARSGVNGTPAATATATDPAAVVAESARRFAAAGSYQLTFTLRVQGLTGALEGDAAYDGAGPVYARLSSSGDEAGDGAVAQYLLLLPDLYLQLGDGTWYVQSPWNQGEHTGESIAHGLVRPMIDYRELAGALQDIEQRDDGDAADAGLDRYRGTTTLRDLPSLGSNPGDGTPVTVDVWIARDTGLPAKADLRIGGDQPGRLEVTLSGFDEQANAPPIPAGARPVRDAQFPEAPCTRGALAACLDAQTAITSTSTCAGTERRVCIAPLGMVSTELVDDLVGFYRTQYGLDVTVLRPSAIPASFEDPKREQVDAGRLLAYLGELFPAAYADPDAVLIGLTPIDVYDSQGTWRYVFGVKRTAAQPQAIVSSSRMDPLFYGEPADQGLFFTRTRKLVSKYVGLLYYALPTSSDPRSPMYDSIGGPDDVDRMTQPLPVQRG